MLGSDAPSRPGDRSLGCLHHTLQTSWVNLKESSALSIYGVPILRDKDVIPVLSKVTEMPSLSWEDGDLISTWVLSTALTLNLFILPLTAEPAVTVVLRDWLLVILPFK